MTIENGETEEWWHPREYDSNCPFSGTTAILAPRISKAWAIESAHAPIYTGGKISPCYLARPQRNEDRDDGDAMEDDDENGSSTTPCLLVPVSGDVAIVDGRGGVKLGSVRAGSRDTCDQDYEDAEGIDGEAITAYALSKNRTSLVTCSHNHLIQQYAFSMKTAPKKSEKKNTIAVTLQKKWGRSGHSLPVSEMEFHQSGVFMATGSVDGSVRIWDAREGHVTHIFRPLAGGSGGGSGRLDVTSIQWIDDSVLLVIAIGRGDGSIAIHDLRDKDMKNVLVLRDHISAITCMEWWWKYGTNEKSSNGYPTMFVTAARDAILNLWQVEESCQNTSEIGKKKMHSKLQAEFGDFSCAKTQVYVRKHTLPIYEQIEGMVVLPNADHACKLSVVTAGSKGVVRIWESVPSDEGEMGAFAMLAEQAPAEAYGESKGGYLGLCRMETKLSNASLSSSFSTTMQQHIIVSDAEHSLSFLSIAGTRDDKLVTKRTVVGYNDEVLDLKVIPSSKSTARGSRIVVATNSAEVRIFDTNSWSCHVLDQHTATVLCVDVSPCGRYIATSGKDKLVCLWHTDSRKCVAKAVGHTEAVGAAALSRKASRYGVMGKAARNGEGSFVVTTSLDRTLKRWNLPGNADLESCAKSQTKEALPLDAFASTCAHEKDINVVSIAPNDSLLATGSQDKSVKLWRSTDLNLIATLKGHRRGVWDCQFSPSDRVLATASGDRSIRLWSLSDYCCVRTFKGHIASVLRVRFLHGGLQLVSSGADGLVKLWTIRANKCETTMDGHSGKVWALDVAATGTTVISGSADSQILVWKDTTDEVESEKHGRREDAILLDQRLANHMRHKQFSQALDIALTLDKPHLALKVLTSIIEGDVKERTNPLVSLREYIPKWSIERVAQVLQYCREWNTQARNCDMANLVVRATVSVLPAHNLAAADGIPEILANVAPYTERHFRRFDRMFTNSYIMDYALFSASTLENPCEDEFGVWESQSRLALPQVCVEGKTQGRGEAIVDGPPPAEKLLDADSEVSMVGDSESSNDEDNGNLKQ